MNCHRHPDRAATSSLYGIHHCRECVAADLSIYRRAYGTGVGPEAHAEAQESGALQAEYERGRTEPREQISRGGSK